MNLKYIRASIVFLVISSCGGGGGGSSSSSEIPSVPQAPNLSISISELPSRVSSYDRLELSITSNYLDCSFSISGSDIHWPSSSGSLYSFNAPITLLEQELFNFSVSSIPTSTCPSGQKDIELLVSHSDSKYLAIPDNNSQLKTSYYHSADLGFGGLVINERYSATICYPTPDDCTTYVNQLFGQDAHNMAVGDFNGDGHEDLVVMWAIFPHTIEESQKVLAPLHIYLNDGKGGLYEDMNIFENNSYPIQPFAYRLAVRDFNSDGIDDIFAGSMGKQVRFEDSTQDYIAPSPHLLMLSNQNGRLVDSSQNIDDQNNGQGQKCGFAHDASSGDFDGDGDFDIYACNLLHVNNGFGEFSIHPYLGYEWHTNHMSPMSSLVTDLNNDSFDDILFWNFDNRPLFDSQPEEGTILLSNDTANIEEWLELELPKGPFDINRNKYNHAASGDLNGDGFNDVVVSITRDDPYYDGAYIQILINDQTGKLVDKTSSNFANQSRFSGHHGEGNIYLRDIDGDGDIDIIHSTRDFENSLSGAHIAINDGQGNFASNEYLLPDRPMPNSQWNPSSGLMKGVPIDLDGKGCIDIVSTSDSWSDENTVRNYLFSMINVDCSF